MATDEDQADENGNEAKKRTVKNLLLENQKKRESCDVPKSRTPPKIAAEANDNNIIEQITTTTNNSIPIVYTVVKLTDETDKINSEEQFKDLCNNESLVFDENIINNNNLNEKSTDLNISKKNRNNPKKVNDNNLNTKKVKVKANKIKSKKVCRQSA